MSNEASKADQIAYRYYTKLASVVYNARATADPNPQARVDKWFNLETPDPDIFKEHLRPYRSLSTAPNPSPFELQVLLSIPDLSANQVLVCRGADSSRLRIEPTPRQILLESWSVHIQPRRPSASGDTDFGLSTVYKHGIGLFRSIYTLLRVLPAWKLHKRLRRRIAIPTNRNVNLSIELRVRTAREPDGLLGFDVRPAAGAPALPTESHAFPVIPHPHGNIALSVRYLTNPHFQLDELESLLSSRFFSLDEGADFTPTLAKNQQRDSLSSSPGSLPLRTSLPASPPSATSLADRMAVRQGLQPSQTHSRTTSFPIFSTSVRNLSLQGSRAGPAADTASAISGHSSVSSRQEAPGLPTPGPRPRKESTGSDLPSVPGPLPIRRPQLNPLNPFKASTLSSGSPSLHSPSPSLRQASPLPARGPAVPPVPSSPRVPPSPSSFSRLSSSPVAPIRPSPPFQPGSLGDRRSINSAEGVVGVVGSLGAGGGEGRKRYSSSFGHRYKDSLGGASEVSAGSADRRERESDKGGSPSYLGANQDEEDLSAFVNDTSQPKPLNRHYRAHNPDPLREPLLAGQIHDRPTRFSRPSSPATAAAGYTREGSESGNALGLGLAGAGPLLTSEDAVDDQLRRMNATFVASLESFGGPRRRERTRSSPGPSPRPGSRDGSDYRQMGPGSPGLRAQRISEVTEEASGSGSASASGSAGQSSREDAARAHMQGLLGRAPPRPGSRTDSITSEEVIGKLELDERRQR
ncbi:autophagy-related protein 13-domain-containing protein [Gloeopeniophorella convolvens]|nr:autophagy-related protein 13-domain-containing protein [Gloeopeniophorella convolvens]